MWIRAAVAARFNFLNLPLFHAGTVLQMLLDFFSKEEVFVAGDIEEGEREISVFCLRLNFDGLVLY